METKILKVVQCGEVVAVPSQKAESGQVMKRTVVLQELGGRYEDRYSATLIGAMAENGFTEGDLVATRLRFQTHEFNGNMYQDVSVLEMSKLNINN